MADDYLPKAFLVGYYKEGKTYLKNKPWYGFYKNLNEFLILIRKKDFSDLYMDPNYIESLHPARSLYTHILNLEDQSLEIYTGNYYPPDKTNLNRYKTDLGPYCHLLVKVPFQRLSEVIESSTNVSLPKLIEIFNLPQKQSLRFIFDEEDQAPTYFREF